MSDESDHTDGGVPYGPIEIDRRTLTKLAGIAGITVLGASPVGGSDAESTNQVTIQMNIQPTFDNVLVQLTESGDQNSPGNSPQQEEDALSEGIVRAHGDEVTQVSEGDTVLFEGSGTEILVAGEDHLLVQEGQILVVVEN